MFITCILFILITLQKYTDSLQVGNPCVISHSGRTGTCTLGNECYSSQRLTYQGIKPTICGYGHNRQVIICCEVNVELNENSFLNLESDSSFDGTFIQRNEMKPNLTTQVLNAKKCSEYYKPLTDEVQILPLIAGAFPTTVNVTKCEYDSIPLIVGGTPASLGEFPFMAALGFKDENNEIQWNCGGTLISNRFVLTAAHCIYTPSFGPPVRVRLGDLNLERSDDGAAPVDFRIDKIIVHPNYTRQAKYNDIALLKLERRIEKFTHLIRPACLNNDLNFKKSTGIATGWGLKETAGEKSSILLKVSLTIFSNTLCSRTYEVTRGLPDGITKSMICAGAIEGGKDTCQGDSGGPLLIAQKDNNCLYFVAGITSFGKICGAKSIPAVYTRVSEYVPWIEKIVW